MCLASITLVQKYNLLHRSESIGWNSASLNLSLAPSQTLCSLRVPNEQVNVFELNYDDKWFTPQVESVYGAV